MPLHSGPFEDLETVASHALDVLAMGQGSVPVNPLTDLVLSGLTSLGRNHAEISGSWQRKPDGGLYQRRLGKTGGWLDITLPSSFTQETRWSSFAPLGALSLDVFLLILAQLSDLLALPHTSAPLRHSVIVSANQIIRYKGVKRWGKERRALRQRIDQIMGLLQSVHVSAAHFPGWNPKERGWSDTCATFDDAGLFEIMPGEQATACAGEAPDSQWRIRYGPWADHWINAQGHAPVTALPARIIELDHRPNRGAHVVAKKISAMLFLRHCQAGNGEVLTYRVDQLLELIGELPTPTARKHYWAGRLCDRLSEAMILLEEQSLLDMTYADGSKARADAERRKGWVKHWLMSRVLVRLLHSPKMAT